MIVPTNPRTKRNPRDHTGNQKTILAELHAEELAKRKDEIAMFQAQQKAGLDEPIALDEKGRTIQTVSEEAAEEGPVDIPPTTVNIRIACDLEKVTIGQGTDFDFKEGQVYTVPLHVAQHLDRLGYVWQWL
ncbi:hypothetical protein [Actinacidiphila sp. ITFR-21]|uniref:hypothetical protein n=1 Tax=Actinacidiphila sp. ITFR-21 TaxID=3075199 RepID=UPI00288C48F9|nr:hypothetical protein [Streptomyces sp. ITFR-21]WNI17631.1 hypothetical protein RLT57_20290 [Streptomyces sp. ITFR-21]WNI17771.1 hypothetical protein RLT57_21005 [Streptomyces sp. ITFR-21]